MMTFLLLMLVALWILRKVRRLQRRLLLTTDKRMLSDLRAERAKARAKVEQIDLWHMRYPNGIVRPAIDDTTGASVFEVDIHNWAYVRSLEFTAYGAYYHRADGTTNACGWEPIDEEGESMLSQHLAAQAARAKADKIVAAEMARTNELRGQHMSKRTELIAATRARIIAEGMADEDPHVTPPSIWGYQMDERLRKAGLRPDTEGVLEWGYETGSNDSLTKFTAMYHGSRMYNAINLGGHWHVTCDS